MPQIERDEAREERITMEAVVDAYSAEEQVMGQGKRIKFLRRKTSQAVFELLSGL
jgi:hypothetical protein